MKGMIFNEFFEMVDEVFSPEMTEKIIDQAKLPNHGAYTDTGTYDHHDIVRLVTQLSAETGISIPELEQTYGKYLFKKLWVRYSDVIKPSNNVLDFLKSVDAHVHVEVLKLYPDAELPRFECTDIARNKMKMIYRSNHPFQDLAVGLIQGAADHFKQKIHIASTLLPATTDKKFNVEFTITRE